MLPSVTKYSLLYLAEHKFGMKTEQGDVYIDDLDRFAEAGACGKQDFEGLKAYRTKDGSVQLFRPDRNAARMQTSCERLLMPQVPTDMFVDAVKQVVKANQDYVPPYGTGATLYLRPLMIGVGGNIGVHPAQEYIFTVFAMPVGSYFKGGMTPTNFTTSEYDRAAHKGTGAYKVGGNYAASLFPGQEAHA
ncbi:branched-chain amino acid aminotransferase, partial [Lactiplantibacillus plantarum]